jgi:predicted nucleotidyltransferase
MDSLVRRQLEGAAAALIAAGAREVYLFGSAALEGGHDAADIDLAVSGLAPERFFRAMSAAAVLLGKSGDTILIKS